MEYFNRFTGLSAQKGYDEKTALSLAVACDLAYCGKSKIISTVKSWGFTPIDVISKRKGVNIDTQCFIMEHGRDVVVVFRGTNSAQDGITDIESVQSPGPFKGTKAHKGFMDALHPIVVPLTRHVSEAHIANKRIWITGHSLGGGLCSLYAGMLLENSLGVYGIYTFASPRPADKKFEKQLNGLVSGAHYRVANDGDIVPHLPPEPHFSHPGKRVILKADKKEHSKGSWFKQRVNALKYFVNDASDQLYIASYHRLSADNKSYIPRLIKDLKRAKR